MKVKGLKSKILTSVLLVLLLLVAVLPSFIAPQPVYANPGYPQVAAVNGGVNNTSGTSHTVNLPSGIVSGNLLLVLFGCSGNPTVTFPSGWVQLFNTENSLRFVGYYRIADGTEGSTITVTTGSSVVSAHISFRITDYSGTPECGTSATGIGVSPDPPSLTPTWGEAETLWVACCGHLISGGSPYLYGLPTNYGSAEGYSNTTGVEVGSCRREYTSDTENPGTFSLSGGANWVAQTIAVQPEPNPCPLVTTNATTNVEETTATLNGNVTAINDTSITERGFVWDTSTHGAPGNVAPAASGYANNWTESGSFGTGIFNSLGSTLYEYYNTGDDSWNYIYQDVWLGQTFTPSTAHTITSVKLLLFRVGSPGTITVGIRATSGGLPTGADLCSGTTNGNTLPTGSPYEWREITLGAGYDLVASTKYAIVIRAISGDGDNHMGWLFDFTTAIYAGGNYVDSNDSGVNWTSYENPPDETYDFMFEEWGEEIAYSSLTEGELYYVRACAQNDLNNWAYGDEVTFLTKPDPPSTFTATATGEDQIDLAWTNGDGADKVYIRGKLGSAPTNRTDGAYSWNGTGTTTSHTGLSAGQHWYYIIWSYVTEGALEQTSDTPDLSDDATTFTPPSITSLFVEGTGSEASGCWVILRGQVTDDEGLAVDTVGFNYGLTTGYGSTISDTGDWNTGDDFVLRIGGLAHGTTYHWRAFASSGAATGYGGDMYFTTIGSDTLYEYWNSIADLGDSTAIYAGNEKAEYFTVGITSHTVTSIKVYLKRVLLPGTITVSIRHADDAYKPTGLDLCSGTYNGNNLSTSYSWVEFTVDEISLEASGEYAVVVKAVAGDGSNYVIWGKDTNGGLDDAFGWSSTDGGTTWSSDSPVDYLFEIWGNPCIRIIGGAVFQDYEETGDMLFTCEYLNFYPPYYPNGIITTFFTLQLYDTDGVTLIAQTACRQWGDMPGAIYLSADQASGLTSGSAFYIKLYGLFSGNPVASYQFQGSDWLGSDKAQLDNWVLATAGSIGTYYGVNYITTTSTARVLTQDGGVIFAQGIPSLDTVRPSLFSVSGGQMTNPGEAPGTIAPEADWETEIGAPTAAIFNTVGGFFGFDGKDAAAFCLIAFYLLIVIGGVTINAGNIYAGKVDSALAGGLGFPLVIYANYIGLISFAILATLLACCVALLSYSFWWSRV